MQRREHPVSIRVNGRKITKVIVDSHYEAKHSSSITDALILELVKKLDGGDFEPEFMEGPYQYFVTDQMELNRRKYKLIWLLEDHEIYIGVINAYRRR